MNKISTSTKLSPFRSKSVALSHAAHNSQIRREYHRIAICRYLSVEKARAPSVPQSSRIIASRSGFHSGHTSELGLLWTYDVWLFAKIGWRRGAKLWTLIKSTFQRARRYRRVLNASRSTIRLQWDSRLATQNVSHLYKLISAARRRIAYGRIINDSWKNPPERASEIEKTSSFSSFTHNEPRGS